MELEEAIGSIKFGAKSEIIKEMMEVLEKEQKRTGLGFIQYKRIKELLGVDELQP